MLSGTPLRLVSGTCPGLGRVELQQRATSASSGSSSSPAAAWGTVCSEGWDDRDASVVCRRLGYRYGYALTSPASLHYAPGDNNTPVHLTGVDCTGSETSLDACRGAQLSNRGDYGGRGGLNSVCLSHELDAGVVCRDSPRGEMPVVPAVGPNSYYQAFVSSKSYY